MKLQFWFTAEFTLESEGELKYWNEHTGFVCRKIYKYNQSITI